MYRVVDNKSIFALVGLLPYVSMAKIEYSQLYQCKIITRHQGCITLVAKRIM